MCGESKSGVTAIGKSSSKLISEILEYERGHRRVGDKYPERRSTISAMRLPGSLRAQRGQDSGAEELGPHEATSCRVSELSDFSEILSLEFSSDPETES